MNTLTRLVNDYLPVLFASQCYAESGDGPLLRDFVHRRDADAFAELLRRHGPMVLGLARRIVGERQMAEDIFQATFLVLARKAHTLRRPESLPAWLHGVAVRLALRTRKAASRRKQEEARASAGAAVPDPLDELSARELLAVLDEELQRLPENHRLPLILCGLEGLSQEEAARRLGWSAGALKGRLERGRRSLRRRLAKRGLTLPAALVGSVLLGDWAAAMTPALVIATRELALTGRGASATVTALAAKALRPVLATKWYLAAATLALVTTLGVGLAWWQGRPAAPAEAPAPPAVVPDQPQPASDPLPAGAILRLGTLERRAVGAQLAISADGKTIIGVRGERYVHLWDAETGRLRERHELQKRNSGSWAPPVTALSPHGRLFATADYPGTAMPVWDVLSGTIVRSLPMPSHHPVALAFSPDDTMLAAIYPSAPPKHTLYAWDIKTGKRVLEKPMDRAVIDSDGLQFTPDGRLLLILGGSQFSVHDIASGQQRWLADSAGGTRWHTFTADGKLLMQNFGAITAWDLPSGKQVPFDRGPPREWNGPITMTPDGKTLLVGGRDGVLVWDVAAGKAIRTLAGAGESMVLAPDGRTVLTNNGALQYWDLATGKAYYPDTFAQGHVDEVTAVKFSADGTRLASGSADGSVRLWDATSGRPLRVWRGHDARRTSAWRAPRGGVTALDLAPDGNRVVSAGFCGHLRVWDGATGQLLRTLALPPPNHADQDRSVPTVHIRAAGRWVTAVVARAGDYRDPRLVTWDLGTGAIVRDVPTDICYEAVCANHADVLTGNATVIDLVSGRRIAQLARRDKDQAERPYAVSTDGALAVGGLAQPNGPAGGGVWEAHTGKFVMQFPTRWWFGCVAFHPDGRHIAINGLDDDVYLVDVTTGKTVATFPMPEKIPAGTTKGSYVNCMAFAPDGRRLATGHPDGSILLWEVKLPRRPPAALGAGEAEALWADLAHADAARAWRAVWRLSDSPDAALPLARKHLQPVLPAPAAVTRPLVADLDSDDFTKRAAATTGLRKLGFRAVPALEVQRAGNVSVEAKRRIAALLEEMEKAPSDRTPEALAHLRAVAALARMESPAARTALAELAKGVRLAPVTRAAQAALGR